jgi:hypothetical protein
MTGQGDVMATAVAIYDGKTVHEFELLMMTTDPAVVERVMTVLTEGGEVYARPHRKNASPRVSLRLVDDEKESAEREPKSAGKAGL